MKGGIINNQPMWEACEGGRSTINSPINFFCHTTLSTLLVFLMLPRFQKRFEPSKEQNIASYDLVR
jgi:hypothetical protein